MQAGKAYMERHDQELGTEYRKYGLEVPRWKWKTPQKVVKNGRGAERGARKEATAFPVVIGAT